MSANAGPVLELTDEQVLWFRARQGHLAGPGAKNAAEAARAIIGAQAQQLPPALHALFMRMRSRPTADHLAKSIFSAKRTLVWTWGQRGTLHLYDAKQHWRQVIAACDGHWTTERPGAVKSQRTIDKARAHVESFDRPITRADMIGIAPDSYVQTLAERAAGANMDVQRLAASRLIWRLTQDGHMSLAENIGSERSYAQRAAWFPTLDWPDDADGHAAAVQLARQYLHVYGPATVQDIAHFFKAKVSTARTWVADLQDELIDVACNGRTKLLALAAHETVLREKAPPASGDEWPVRLLPLWESMLMAHKDKSWTVPSEAERKDVWRKAAMVAAVVLARGRVVATWTQKKKANHLEVDVQPLSGWKQRSHLPGVRQEANAIAQHLGLDEARVSVA